jgi:hypothetical protein
MAFDPTRARRHPGLMSATQAQRVTNVPIFRFMDLPAGTIRYSTAPKLYSKSNNLLFQKSEIGYTSSAKNISQLMETEYFTLRQGHR